MENNVKLLWTLLKKRTDGLSAKDKFGQNILHFLAYYSKSDKFRHVYDNEVNHNFSKVVTNISFRLMVLK